MSLRIHSQAEFEVALRDLVGRDQRLAALLERAGPIALRRRTGGFEGLISVVVSQQLSTASAAAIFGRLAAAFDPLDAAALLRARPTRLAKIGLSAPKIKTLKEIARVINKGALALEALIEQDADQAHERLIAVHGIGPWTADIYLLFCLGHSDAWPAGDLALQETVRHVFALEKRPSTKEMIAKAEIWRPYRGVAAHLFWAYYRVLKRREGMPLQPSPKGA